MCIHFLLPSETAFFTFVNKIFTDDYGEWFCSSGIVLKVMYRNLFLTKRK